MLDAYPIETYSPERIQDAYLIIHPNMLMRYEITRDKFYGVFEEWSNFTQLENPIIDENGLKYYDSEWYYMAQRFDDMKIKRAIAETSKEKWKSKEKAYEYEKQMDKNKSDRIWFMRDTIKQKYWRNRDLLARLLETSNREIIEFTFWNDDFFGISHDNRQWRNVLGKLHMEYRDDLIAQVW